MLVTHGGVEMGQGLHTKVAQVVAQDLGVPLASVFIAETSTDKVPNASPTAASASSDMYGAAAADACAQLNARLAPLRERMPGASFKVSGGGAGVCREWWTKKPLFVCCVRVAPHAWPPRSRR